MRKFVIKNRQKRKYVRKIKQVHSFSLSKTILGMMPILVMIIAFMATIIISTSFRNALTQIHFHLQTPQISFRNPLSAMQTVTQDSIQIGVAIGTMIITTTFFIGKTIQNAEISIISFAKFLDPRPLFFTASQFTVSFANLSWNILMLIEKGIILYNNTVAQTKIAIALWILSGVRMISLDLMSISSLALQGVLAIVIAIWQMIISAFIFLMTLTVNVVIVASQVITAVIEFIQAEGTAFAYTVASIAEFIGHIVFAITLTLFHFLEVILLAVWNGAVFAWITTITTISHVVATIVHFIEIPFNILYAFWLQIKPYVMIFNTHVQMTDNDLSNGFTSLGKIGSIINAKN